MHGEDLSKDRVFKDISFFLSFCFLVIYNDRLTDAFMGTVMKLFNINPDAVLYLALEKR